MRRILILGVLLSSQVVAEEQAQAIPGGLFYFGPGFQLPYAGGPLPGGLVLSLHAAFDTGDWMIGADARAGILRSPSLLLGYSARVDRFLQASNDSFYVGGSFGALDEFDGESYGGDGPFVGAQVGYLWGRSRRWGRAAIELQLSVPLFGERPNKPGNYVFTFVSLGFRFLL